MNKNLPDTLPNTEMVDQGKGLSHEMQMRRVWIPSRRFMAKANESVSHNFTYSFKKGIIYRMSGTTTVTQILC